MAAATLVLWTLFWGTPLLFLYFDIFENGWGSPGETAILWAWTFLAFAPGVIFLAS